MTEKQIRLGDAEREALGVLHQRGGTWDASTDRALWENTHWSLSLMASLSRKECVRVTGERIFQITPAGRLAVRQNPSR